MASSDQPEPAHKLVSRLAPQSLKVTTETHRVRYNGELPEIDRLYLQVEGTPDAFRYLSSLLVELANRAEKSEELGTGTSVILDPQDLNQLELSEWSAIELNCRKQLVDS